MGIRFTCPSGHKLNVKSFLAGRTGFCPYCGVKVEIPMESTRGTGRKGSGAPSAGPSQAIPTAGKPSAPAVATRPVEPLQPLAPSPGAAQFGQGASPGAGLGMPTLANMAPGGGIPNVDFAAHMEALATSAAAAVTPPPLRSGPVDPLSEAPDAVWYIRPPSGGQFGPAAGNIVRAWIQEGRVSADTLVWREGWRDWQEAAAVFPQLGGPAAVSASTPGAFAASGPSYPARQKPASSRALHIGALLVVVIVLSGLAVWLLLREFREAEPADTGMAAPAVFQRV